MDENVPAYVREFRFSKAEKGAEVVPAVEKNRRKRTRVTRFVSGWKLASREWPKVEIRRIEQHGRKPFFSGLKNERGRKVLASLRKIRKKFDRECDSPA